ncbi:hypothetical protein RFI_23298 [Reticulomyxa filosa]|uniref:Condensin complex subunit 2 n=1 Tax=Reticulomyxa filosa TaxID=46433 RepID=X6MLV8_RETFI|nr:hypothetical protein RFI_23298 [Reticulomyxa filosa]|eukprot:ETO14070.1 hypothetical protein RFI_23298 [Reticulomyxa filosa]
MCFDFKSLANDQTKRQEGGNGDNEEIDSDAETVTTRRDSIANVFVPLKVPQDAFDHLNLNATQVFNDELDDVQHKNITNDLGSVENKDMSVKIGSNQKVVDGIKTNAFPIQIRRSDSKPNSSKFSNLTLMNQFIQNLENRDIENVTMLFDAKKDGNWRGPDQWYHRRYQLTIDRQKKQLTNTEVLLFLLLYKKKQKDDFKTPRKDKTVAEEDNDGSSTKKKSGKSSKSKESKFVDFLIIGSGKFTSNKELESTKNDNCLTEKVLRANKHKAHLLPIDFHIKPDMFIKMFIKPNYSHQYLSSFGNKHKKAFARGIDSKQAHLLDSAYNIGLDEDDKNADLYWQDVDSNHQINTTAGYDLLQSECISEFDMIEAPAQVNKVTLDFATKAKKVDVRKLKQCLWEQITNNLTADHVTEKEAAKTIATTSVLSSKSNTFMNSMEGLSKNIDTKELSNLSVPFCFICLLHLANEQNLVLAENENEPNGNFFIQEMFVKNVGNMTLAEGTLKTDFE